MFGKKSRIIITIEENTISVKSIGKLSLNDIANTIVALTESAEKETGIKSNVILATLAFDLI